MNEIKLTEAQFIEMDRYLYSNEDSDNSRTLRLILAKQKGWIVKDEIKEAIEEYKNYSDSLRRRTYYPKIEEELLLIKKCNTAVDLLQKRIQELEAGK